MLPKAQSTDLAAKLKSEGVKHELREARDMPHGSAECIKVFPPWEKELGQDRWDEAIRPGLDFVVAQIQGPKQMAGY